MGRLTKDPDVRYSGNDPVAKFTLAVDRRRTSQNGEREADFIPCVAFKKQAEFCEKYLHQGTKVALSGRMQTGSYTNKNGQTVYTTDVIVEEIEFAESKQNTPQQTAPKQNEIGQGFLNIPDAVEDEGLPFN